MGRLLHFLRVFFKKMSADHVRAFSAEASFFMLMSFFPLLMMIGSLVRFIPVDEKQLIALFETATPFEVTSSVTPFIRNLLRMPVPLMTFNLVAALWAAGKCIIGMTDGINCIYRVEEEQNYIILRLRASFYAILLTISLLVSGIILIFGYDIVSLLMRKFPLLKEFRQELLYFPTILAVVLLFCFFTVLYAWLPKQKKKLHRQLPGAAFAAVAISIGSYLFSYYIELAASISVLYGSLASLIMIMLWLYMSMYLFFMGAEVNHYIGHREFFVD